MRNPTQSISLFLVLLSVIVSCNVQPSECMADEPDPIAQLQASAAETGKAEFGHWGPNTEKYSSWVTHSNRLVPLYIFGGNLEAVKGSKSPYRSEDELKKLYGSVPKNTLNPKAKYFDQTAVHSLQEQAIASGKKKVVLFVFDGMDWRTTQAAAIAKQGKIPYTSGRGTGLAFQDYGKAETDYGFFVSSPHNNGTDADVNKQTVRNPGGSTAGGYDPRLGGRVPWSGKVDAKYLLTKNEEMLHAYTDSASSATSMTTGKKTYNNAINVDFSGRELIPIARTLQEKGFAVGAVTSVPISHATPACSYANNVNRGDYQDVSRDMLGIPSIFHPGGLEGLDVVIGCGFGEKVEKDGKQGDNFVPGNKYLTDEDKARIAIKNGGKYVVAQRTAGKCGADVIAAAAKKAVAGKHRLFGFFGVDGGHLPFQTADGGYDPVASLPKIPAEQYRDVDVSENPNLAQMALAAIEVLDAKSDDWWLMVEPGDVDWANHANNIDNSIGAVLSGENAFIQVTNWIEANCGWDEALVIVTADHGHYLVLDRPELLAK